MKRNKTKSICPVCYERIDADIIIDIEVWMEKECPVHGKFSAKVEVDPEFYEFINKDSEIPQRNFFLSYCTSRCNMNCGFCYYPIDNNTPDRPKQDIINEALKYNTDIFVLLGGEPTMREDLFEITRELRNMGRMPCVCTNGLKLADKEYLNKMLKSGIVLPYKDISGNPHRTMHMMMSMFLKKHMTDNAARLKELALQNIKDKKIKLMEIAFTIADLTELPEALDFIESYKGIVLDFRIRTAGTGWNSPEITTSIFLSDLFKEVQRIAKERGIKFETVEDTHRNTKHLVCVNYNDSMLRLLSYPDKYNIDLIMPEGGQYIETLDGELENIVNGIILNRKHTDYENNN